MLFKFLSKYFFIRHHLYAKSCILEKNNLLLTFHYKQASLINNNLFMNMDCSLVI